MCVKLGYDSILSENIDNRSAMSLLNNIMSNVQFKPGDFHSILHENVNYRSTMHELM